MKLTGPITVTVIRPAFGKIFVEALAGSTRIAVALSDECIETENIRVLAGTGWTAPANVNWPLAAGVLKFVRGDGKHFISYEVDDNAAIALLAGAVRRAQERRADRGPAPRPQGGGRRVPRRR